MSWGKGRKGSEPKEVPWEPHSKHAWRLSTYGVWVKGVSAHAGSTWEVWGQFQKLTVKSTNGRCGDEEGKLGKVSISIAHLICEQEEQRWIAKPFYFASATVIKY